MIPTRYVGFNAIWSKMAINMIYYHSTMDPTTTFVIMADNPVAIGLVYSLQKKGRRTYLLDNSISWIYLLNRYNSLDGVTPLQIINVIQPPINLTQCKGDKLRQTVIETYAASGPTYLDINVKSVMAGLTDPKSVPGIDLSSIQKGELIALLISRPMGINVTELTSLLSIDKEAISMYGIESILDANAIGKLTYHSGEYYLTSIDVDGLSHTT
jgi:hypothetical protein